MWCHRRKELSVVMSLWRTLCYQPLADPRSAVWAAWWDASSLFFPLSVSIFSLCSSHIDFTLVWTHTHTRVNIVLIYVLFLCKNFINEEVLGNSWTMWPVYSFLKHKHSEKWRGPLQRNTFSNNSLAVAPPLPVSLPPTHSFPQCCIGKKSCWDFVCGCCYFLQVTLKLMQFWFWLCSIS